MVELMLEQKFSERRNFVALNDALDLVGWTFFSAPAADLDNLKVAAWTGLQAQVAVRVARPIAGGNDYGFHACFKLNCCLRSLASLLW